MTFSITNALDDEYPRIEQNRKAKSDCQNTIIYCSVSIALLILAGGLGNPAFVATLPGGAVTASVLSIVIVVAVLLLCVWQRPRKPALTTTGSRLPME
ncbi:MAG: hypothetical protein ACW98Y_05705 [Candidatus Thorarchaeota archaeon]